MGKPGQRPGKSRRYGRMNDGDRDVEHRTIQIRGERITNIIEITQ